MAVAMITLAVAAGIGIALVIASRDAGESRRGFETPSTETNGHAETFSDVQIGLAFDIGGLGDKSFNDAAAIGLDQAIDDFGVSTQAISPNEAGTNRSYVLRLLSADEFDLTIAVGFLFADTVCETAQDHPGVHFAVVDGFINEDTCAGRSELTEDSNVASLLFAEEQGSFLVGAAAALKSQTDHIGFVGGVESDLIKKFEAGYAAGARQINPGIEIDVEYVSQPPDLTGFNDPAKTRHIASTMYEGGSDVIYHAAASSGSGLFKAAVQKSDALGIHLWAIGMDADQFQTATLAQQPHILTSMVKRVDVAVYRTIQEEVSGDFTGGYKDFELADDGVDYSTSGGHLTVEEIELIDDLKRRVADGEIRVPEAPQA